MQRTTLDRTDSTSSAGKAKPSPWLVAAVILALAALTWLVWSSTRTPVAGPAGGGAVATAAPSSAAPTPSSTLSAGNPGGRPWFTDGTPQAVARGYLMATKSVSFQDASYTARLADAQQYATAAQWAQIAQGMTNTGHASDERDWAAIQAAHRKIGVEIEDMVFDQAEQVVVVRYHMVTVDDSTSTSGRVGSPQRIAVSLVQESGSWRVTTTSTEAN